jgi:hypothetical protein
MRLLWRRFKPISVKWVARLHDRRHVFQIYRTTDCAHIHIWHDTKATIAQETTQASCASRWWNGQHLQVLLRIFYLQVRAPHYAMNSVHAIVHVECGHQQQWSTIILLVSQSLPHYSRAVALRRCQLQGCVLDAFDDVLIPHHTSCLFQEFERPNDSTEHVCVSHRWKSQCFARCCRLRVRPVLDDFFGFEA